MLQIGDVDFDTAGGDDYNFVFAGVAQPDQVVQQVDRATQAGAAGSHGLGEPRGHSAPRAAVPRPVDRSARAAPAARGRSCRRAAEASRGCPSRRRSGSPRLPASSRRALPSGASTIRSGPEPMTLTSSRAEPPPAVRAAEDPEHAHRVVDPLGAGVDLREAARARGAPGVDDRGEHVAREEALRVGVDLARDRVVPGARRRRGAAFGPTAGRAAARRPRPSRRPASAAHASAARPPTRDARPSLGEHHQDPADARLRLGREGSASSGPGCSRRSSRRWLRRTRGCRRPSPRPSSPRPGRAAARSRSPARPAAPGRTRPRRCRAAGSSRSCICRRCTARCRRRSTAGRAWGRRPRRPTSETLTFGGAIRS